MEQTLHMSDPAPAPSLRSVSRVEDMEPSCDSASAQMSTFQNAIHGNSHELMKQQHLENIQQEHSVKGVMRVLSLDDSLCNKGLKRKDSGEGEPGMRTRAVSFCEVQIREYERAVSDNPSVSSGPPIGIGWKYNPNTTAVPLESYEETRPKRRSLQEMALPREVREDMLKREWGVAQSELAAAVRSTIKAKNQRRTEGTTPSPLGTPSNDFVHSAPRQEAPREEEEKLPTPSSTVSSNEVAVNVVYTTPLGRKLTKTVQAILSDKSSFFEEKRVQASTRMAPSTEEAPREDKIPTPSSTVSSNEEVTLNVVYTTALGKNLTKRVAVTLRDKSSFFEEKRVPASRRGVAMLADDGDERQAEVREEEGGTCSTAATRTVASDGEESACTSIASASCCSTPCPCCHSPTNDCCRTVVQRQALVQRLIEAILQLHHAATCTDEECSDDCRQWKRWWNVLTTNRDWSITNDDIFLVQQSWWHLQTCRRRQECAICGPVLHEIGTDSPLLVVFETRQDEEEQEEEQDNVVRDTGTDPVQQQQGGTPPTDEQQQEDQEEEQEDEPDNDVPDTGSVSERDPAQQQPQQVGTPPTDDVMMISVETAHQRSSSATTTDRKRKGAAPPTTRPSRRSKVERVPHESLLQEGNQPLLPTPRAPTNATPPNIWETLSADEIVHHLDSLPPKVGLPLPPKPKASCSDFLKQLESHKLGWMFEAPVDPIKLDVPDYFDVVSQPMDLGTVRTALETNRYTSVQEFQRDVLQIFDNELAYQSNGSVVYEAAYELKRQALQEAPTYLGPYQAKVGDHARTCALCGCQQIPFRPPVYFCTDTVCRKRIRRKQHFYTVGNGSHHLFCTSCYDKFTSTISIHTDDGCIQVPKGDLVKHKNVTVQEEPWSQCSECDVWVHQVCGMYNVKQGTPHTENYRCPHCVLFEKEQEKERVEEEENTEEARFWTAQDLPRTRVSDFIERHVKERIATAKRELVQQTAQQENVSLEEATKMIDMGGSITIRQVTCSRKLLKVPKSMQQRYASSNYPLEYPYTSKCFLVFQKLDGIDVALFALYAYEHGDDNPSPNKGRVHISLLDSVHYMRPRQLRTIIYHEVLIRYLDYVRSHGFHTAHIWACPPQNGEDYIFNSKPKDQKRPDDARLRRWYVDMLKKCQDRKIVGNVTNVYDLYFDDESLDATALPFLQGDYISGEVDSVIHELAEGDKEWRPSSMQTIASGEFSKRDPVMVKLAKKIRKMKEDFIVADLPSIDDATRDEPLAGVSDDLLDDNVEEVNYEIFNDRQKLVNLCLGNYYQFGELRRAKHSSMMLLWHMHSRNWS